MASEYDIVVRGGTLYPQRVVADLPADGYAVPIISGVVTYRDGVPTGPCRDGWSRVGESGNPRMRAGKGLPHT